MEPASNWLETSTWEPSRRYIAANYRLTTGVFGTNYGADINFILSTTGSNAAVVSLYGLTSTGADVLAIEPGSYCRWLP